jgi:LysM repeat protein
MLLVINKIDDHLQSNAYLAGEEFSRADLAAASLLAPLCQPEAKRNQAKTITNSKKNKQKNYKVKKGDTLYSIAKRFKTTVENLKDANNLSTNNISIGQQLTIK